MKLIIDIPEMAYDAYKEWHKNNVATVEQSLIANGIPYEERPQGEWGKWVIAEIQCPNCFEYFDTDCYSTEELKKCPNCGADMKGGAE